MRSHDNDIESVQRERAASVPSPQPMGAGLASRALAAGRTDPLDADAVVHLQRSAGNASVARLVGGDRDDRAGSPGSEVRSLVGRNGGSPLDEGTRTSMETRFGQDFGSVRIHTDGQAASATRALSAQAFTVGNEIAFAAGRYDPGSESGQRTLAHELTHVTQQRAGAVDGSPIPGGVRMSDPSDRFERAAAQNAERMIGTAATSPPIAPSGPISAQRAAADGAPATQPLPVQRQAPDEEEADETAQPLAAQRQDAPEEEEEQPAAMMAQRQAAPEEEEEETPAPA